MCGDEHEQAFRLHQQSWWGDKLSWNRDRLGLWKLWQEPSSLRGTEADFLATNYPADLSQLKLLNSLPVFDMKALTGALCGSSCLQGWTQMCQKRDFVRIWFFIVTWFDCATFRDRRKMTVEEGWLKETRPPRVINILFSITAVLKWSASVPDWQTDSQHKEHTYIDTLFFIQSLTVN